MSDKLKASLPGIFSLVLALVFLVIGFIPGEQVQVVDMVSAALLLVGGWLGIAWTKPTLPAQEGDGSIKGNLPGLLTAAVLSMQLVAQNTGLTMETVDWIVDGMLAVTAWLGLPWVPPKLPSQGSTLAVVVLLGLGGAAALIVLALPGAVPV